MKIPIGNTTSSRLARKDYLMLIVLLALAVFTRFYRLGDASLWLDEVFTIGSAQLPWSTLWVTAYDPTPPLFFSTIKLILNFGDNEWLLRLPSAACGVFTVLFVYSATRKLWDARTAFFTGILLTFSLGNIEYSQEARAYAMAGMFIALSFLGLATLNVRWRDSTSDFSFLAFLKSGGAVYAFGALCALYSHNTAVFYWIGAQFFFAVWWVRPFRFSRLCLLSWFAVNFVVLLIWLPWLFASMEVMDTSMFTWLGQKSFSRALGTIQHVYGFFGGYGVQPYTNILLFSLIVWGALGLRKNPVMLTVLLALVLCSTLAVWAYGFLGTPIFMDRTILWGTLFTTVFAGVGISRLPTSLAYLALAVLVMIGALGFSDYHKSDRAENEEWRDAVGVFNSKQQSGDMLMFRTHYVAHPFLYYVKDRDRRWNVLGVNCRKGVFLFGEMQDNQGQLFVSWSREKPTWNTSAPASKDTSLWVVDSHCFSLESMDLSNRWISARWQLAESYEFKAINLYRFVLR